MSGVLQERKVFQEMGIGWLTLNKASHLNALDASMLDDIETAIRAWGGDENIRAVVVTGAGERAFCAGADVTLFPGLSPSDAVALMARGQEVFAQLEACSKPIIAAINGYVLGGGLELAMACDFRVACDSAKFGQPEINLANLPGWGGTQRLPRIVGEAMAKDLIFSGRVIDANEAFAIRLIHQQVPKSDLEDVVMRLAHTIGSQDPLAFARAKEAIHAARRQDGSGYVVERQGVGLCWGTPAQKSALENILNRRAKK